MSDLEKKMYLSKLVIFRLSLKELFVLNKIFLFVGFKRMFGILLHKIRRVEIQLLYIKMLF